MKISKFNLLASMVLTLFTTFAKAEQKETTAQFDYFKYEGKDDWFNKQIDRTSQYMNPIKSGYYPDPSICRKGDTYYLVNSSFGYFPGVPISTSKDLVNWKQIGHVLDRPSQFNFTGKGMSRGIFAPAIEYNPYNDTFYMITTDVGGMGNFYVKTKDPLQGWSDPILLPEVKNIDPSFFFDEDGKAYIVHNDEPENGPDWDQQRTIRIHEFDVENDRTIGKNKEIIRGGANPANKPIWDEGPHLYKINGYYYLMCAEGGTSSGHSEVIFRSKSPWGPFQAAAYNPILTQKGLSQNRENMVTSSGHADLIQTPEGDWWAVFLAVRPYDGKNLYNTGRETFLLPVEWENEFPIILRKGVPIPTVVNKKNLLPVDNFNNGNFTYNQEFNDAKLDFSWIFIRTPEQPFYSINNGKLIIKPLPISIEEQKSPAAVVRRQQHTNFTVETQLEFVPITENDFAGLTLFQNERFQFLFGKTILEGKTVLTIYRIEKDKKLIATVELKGKDAKKAIKLKVDGKGGKCDFRYSFDGKRWNPLVENADATNLSTQHAGGFIGTCIGLYATSAQNSNYFPENCWGVYTWGGGINDSTPQTHPLVKGAPIIMRWKEVEPEPGKFKFDEVIRKKLELAEKHNYYTFLKIWVAPSAPRWLYENGVPELEMTKTINPLGKPRDWTFQYYLDDDYIFYYYRLLSEYGKYVQSLPKNLRNRVLYIQSAEGSTGDGGPYKGNPIDLKYDITNEQWGDFRIKAWEVLKKALSNENGELVKPILVNYDANGEKEYNWLLNNLPVIGLKNGMFSHGYQISDTKTRVENWKKFKQKASEKGIEMFSRGEQDGEWAVYGWSTKNTEQAFYWSGIFATYCDIDMWNVPAEASVGYKHKDGINFFNKYAGQHNPKTASAAFCALSKGLDASDTISYPEQLYGNCLRNNIDRYLKIAAAYSKFGAYQGDPAKAIGTGMLNRKSNDYNDVGWGIFDGNLSRFIDQIDAEATSDGWWHIGPQESIYGRFARSIKMKDGKGGIYFDVNDVFAKECKEVEIRLVWLDKGLGEWTVFYNADKKADKSLFTVKNGNTGKWMERTVLVKDASFANRGERNSDISITTKGNETSVFHLLEVTKK